MTLHTLWALHADAVGAALIVAGIALLIGAWLDYRHQHALRALRGVNRALIHTGLTASLGKARTAGRTAAARAAAHSFDCAADDALAVAQPQPPVRTPLMEAYLDPTIDEPVPYLPVFWDGRTR